MTEFERRVYDAVRMIPESCVATYGQIAEVAGYKGAARAVGNALHRNPDPDGTPCFRVVNAQGRLSECFAFGGANRQRELLLEDGIAVFNWTVDLDDYRWDSSGIRVEGEPDGEE